MVTLQWSHYRRVRTQLNIEHGDQLLLPDIKLATSLPTSFFARFSAFSAIKSFFLHDQTVNTII